MGGVLGDFYTVCLRVQLIFGRKNTLICNLLNLLLLFLSSSFCNNQQPEIVRITSCAATTSLKSTIETPEQHCVKYVQIQAFSDPHISSYMDRFVFVFFHISYTREYGSNNAPVLAYFTSYKMCNMFKINKNGTRIRKVNDKVNNKYTVDVVLVSLLLTLNTFHFWKQCFYLWLWSVKCGWGCHLVFWRFVPAGFTLGKVYIYGETR